MELAQQNSAAVHLAQADVQKALAELAQNHDAFIPSLSFGSGLPAFPEVGFTGSCPSIWDGTMQSMVFSMPQYRYIQAARAGVKAAQLALKDAQEQVALDASTAYIEMDTVNRELEAVSEQEQDAARLVAIEQQRTEAGVDPLSCALAGAADRRATQAQSAASGNPHRDAGQAACHAHWSARRLHHARSRQHSRDSRRVTPTKPRLDAGH